MNETIETATAVSIDTVLQPLTAGATSDATEPVQPTEVDAQVMAPQQQGQPAQQQGGVSLLEMARATSLDLFLGLGSSGERFVTVPVGTTRETYGLDDARFSEWLTLLYYSQTQLSPSRPSIKDVIRTFKAQARFLGQTKMVAVRTAELQGQLYIDLGDQSGQAVEVNAEGWRLVEPPVRFIRPPGQLPLPMPERGGSLAEWRDLVKVTDDNAWVLLLTCVLSMYRPGLPFVILVVQGPQGSAKSTFCQQVRSLVDPNIAPLCNAPAGERDLIISAKNSLLLAFDNLSHVPPRLSDALCRVVTGSGLSTRKLFSDDAEIRMNVIRPVMINGITDLTTRSDFLDRTVNVVLPIIQDSQRKCEADVNAVFGKGRARIFGALMDALSGTLRNLPSVKPAVLPRMADFARFGMAAESVLGFRTGQFMAAYEQDRMAVHCIALESSPIVPVLSLMVEGGSGVWTGVSRDLLKKLELKVKSDERRQSCGWPTSAANLTAQLKRLAPNLRATGLEVAFGHHTKRGITITLKSTTSASSASPCAQLPCAEPVKPVTAMQAGEAGVIGSSPAPEAHNACKQGRGDVGDGDDGKSAAVAATPAVTPQPVETNAA